MLNNLIMKALDAPEVTNKDLFQVITMAYGFGRNIKSKIDFDLLVKKLEKHKSTLAQMFQCEEDDIKFGDLNSQDTYCKVYFGNVRLEGMDAPRAMCNNKIDCLFGDLIVKNCEMEDIGFIKSIMGDVSICNSRLNSLGALERVVGSLTLSDSRIDCFDSMKKITPMLFLVGDGKNVGPVIGLNKGHNLIISKNFNMVNCDCYSLEALASVKGEMNILNSRIEKFGKTEVKGACFIRNNNIEYLDMGKCAELKVVGNRILDFNPEIKEINKDAKWLLNKKKQEGKTLSSFSSSQENPTR